MNHDDDDIEAAADEILADLGYGDDEDGILQDGETLHVGAMFLDSTQRAIADGWDAANHRPGWRVPPAVRDQDRVVAKAFGGYVRYLRDAHKTPTVRDAEKTKPKRPPSLADSRTAADAARDERDAWLRDAYKERRKPGVALPRGWAFGDGQP